MRKAEIGQHVRQSQEYTELRVQENRSATISMVNGSVVQNQRSVTGGVSARSFTNGVWGFASLPEVSDAAIARVIDLAGTNVRFLAGKERRGSVTLPSRPGVGSVSLATSRPRAGQKWLMDFVRTIDDWIAGHCPGLSSRRLQLANLDMEKTLVTADGADAYSLTPRAILYVSLTTAAGPDSIDLYDVFGGSGQFEDVFANPHALFPRIDELYAQLRRKAEGVYPDAGKHEVVLGPDLAGILAHEAVGHTVEADLVLGGSVAGDRLGQPVAAELVTLVDYAHTAFGRPCPVPVHIDDEGVAAQDAVLIDRGILKGFLHNKETAAHFGVAPTGNARAYQFSDEPLVRMRNTAIVPGTSRLPEMIASVDDGYYLMRSSNGQADSTGEFTFGVILGYEIKHGKLGRAIRDTTISGVAFEMLKTVTAVSDDMTWNCSGMCGKKQPIPVGMGGPAVRCHIMIGGR